MKAAIQRSLKFLKEIVTDPGVGIGVVGSLLFLHTTGWGFGARLAATALAVTSKTCSLLRPRALDKTPRLEKFLFDRRTPLQANGFTGMVVAGTTLVMKGLGLPVFTSFFLACGNFIAADRISRLLKEAGEEKTAGKKNLPISSRIKALAFKNPDVFYSAGLACAGLMAGGAALYALPVVALALGVGLRNIVQETPNRSHPMAISAVASAAFSYIGFKNHLPVLGVAHALDMFVRVNIDSRLTTGGFPQLLQDAKGGLATVFKSRANRAEARKTPPQPQPVPEAPKL